MDACGRRSLTDAQRTTMSLAGRTAGRAQTAPGRRTTSALRADPRAICRPSASRRREFLVKLGHVPVMSHAVGVETFRHFGKQHVLLRRPPCPGHAGFRVDGPPQ